MTTLFEPLVFRTGLRAPNRLVLAPMTNLQSHDDGSLGEAELTWLVSRAKGGFGLVMTCASHVARDGQGWKGELGTFDDALLPGLTRLAGALKAQGARSIVQLFHGGVRADSKVSGQPTWSAMEGQGARAATEEDCIRVIEQFAVAAQRAQRAGFDGVEVHGAHGYLFTQFLSAENQRADGWGGREFEKRARLLREAVRAIRARVGTSFTVGVRLSPEDFGNTKGLDLDESLQLARWLGDDGVDFLHLSLWRSALNTRKRPGEHALTAFRAVLPDDVRLLVAGAVWERAEAEALLKKGADGVALGRGAVINADWPLQATDANWHPKRPPASIESLTASGLSKPFAEYLRQWPGFIAD
jgi:2,4-dienoyl-CoA reductase-like NADH-dependent reductase (Old Yellow Enzyme family)